MPNATDNLFLFFFFLPCLRLGCAGPVNENKNPIAATFSGIGMTRGATANELLDDVSRNYDVRGYGESVSGLTILKQM